MIDKHIPNIFAQSFELSKMRVGNKEELEVLKKIKQVDKVKEAIPKQDKNKQGGV